MKLKGVSPNVITYVCSLTACGRVGASSKGEEIHSEVEKKGFLQEEIAIGNALVDMYGNWGSLVKAQEVFGKLPVRNVATWTVLITGYAQLEREEVVVDLFNEMLEEAVNPNNVTFTAILNACSHSGLLDKGQMYFEAMSEQYGIIPTLEHRTCMVDLFGRAGHFGRALDMLEMVQYKNQLPLLLALLGACCKWVNVKLGKCVFDRLVDLDKKCGVAYVGMRNVYSAAAMLDDAEKIEDMRMQNEALV